LNFVQIVCVLLEGTPSRYRETVCLGARCPVCHVQITELEHLAILGTNYGEAGAINLYGPQYGLPQAISGVNSFWVRGYGDPEPQTVIVIGLSQQFL
jgi:hypothetical protein